MCQSPDSLFMPGKDDAAKLLKRRRFIKKAKARHLVCNCSSLQSICHSLPGRLWSGHPAKKGLKAAKKECTIIS